MTSAAESELWEKKIASTNITDFTCTFGVKSTPKQLPPYHLHPKELLLVDSLLLLQRRATTVCVGVGGVVSYLYAVFYFKVLSNILSHLIHIIS